MPRDVNDIDKKIRCTYGMQMAQNSCGYKTSRRLQACAELATCTTIVILRKLFCTQHLPVTAPSIKPRHISYVLVDARVDSSHPGFLAATMGFG